MLHSNCRKLGQFFGCKPRELDSMSTEHATDHLCIFYFYPPVIFHMAMEHIPIDSFPIEPRFFWGISQLAMVDDTGGIWFKSTSTFGTVTSEKPQYSNKKALLIEASLQPYLVSRAIH